MSDERHPQHLRVELHAPGLERALRDAAHIVARAIGHLAHHPPAHVQITAGRLSLDPQEIPIMANIINSLPQRITATWAGVDATGTVVAVVPDSVDYSVGDSTLGSIVPDPANPTGGAIFTATAGALGAVTFGAVAHQAGLADFSQAPLSATLVNAQQAGVQITAGTLSLDPQDAAALRRGSRK